MIVTIRMKSFLFLFVFIISIKLTIENELETDYYHYLQQYGYTPKVEGRRLFTILGKSSYRDAILKLQRLYKLPETGDLDERTKTFMRKPRCGNPDLGNYNSIRRPLNVDKPESNVNNKNNNVRGRSGKVEESKSDTTSGYVWKKKHLKWFIEEYPTKQSAFRSREDIIRIIKQAFQDWEQHSGLVFEMAQSNKTADLRIRFSSKNHDDGYPFDGPGATLAHAFFPESGDIHFDDDEKFTDTYGDTSYETYTLRLVASHEIGHALGLLHSTDEESLMYPLYQPWNASFVLSTGDQTDIQQLYGLPQTKYTTQKTRTTSAPAKTTKYPSNPLPNNNWCAEEFETGCEGPDGELYLFQNNQAWRYQTKKQSWDIRPKSINEWFPSLSDTSITACVKSTIGYTYLFRHHYLWKLKTHWSIDGPHVIHGNHYPQSPRVALLHQNSIYLLRNRLIYRFNEFNFNDELEIRTLDTILNPPPNEHIRSGFTYDKRHYIFTKHHVYVYDSTHGLLLPGYPKPRTNGWFACESAVQVSKWRKKSTTSSILSATKKPSRNHDDDHEDYDRDRHHHRHYRPRDPYHHRHRHNHHYRQQGHEPYHDHVHHPHEYRRWDY